jgi:surface carbohydrate biosynthesis protein
VAWQRHGLQVHIEQHPFGDLLSDLSRFAPRVVALPHWTLPHVPYSVDWPQAIYVNLMWEQLLYKGNFNAKMPRGEFPLRHMIHHSWGDTTAQHLRKTGVPEQKIFVNGNPAYVLYRDPYRRYYERRSELAQTYSLDRTKRWIFFPENYNWAFYDELQLRSVVEGGQSADDVVIMRDFCLRSFEAAIQWCNSIAAQSGAEIIIRPRPATSLEQFQRAVREVGGELHSGLHLIKGESIREWIIASDAVVSSYSTSLVEAAVAGKPTCIIEPFPIPGLLHADWHDLLPHLHTRAEFEAFCRSADAFHDERLGQWAKSSMLSRGDPIVRLADFFAQISRLDRYRPAVARPNALALPPIMNLPPSLLFHFHRTWRKWRRFRRKLAKQQVHPNLTHEKEILARDDIARRLNRWNEFLAGPRRRVQQMPIVEAR